MSHSASLDLRTAKVHVIENGCPVVTYTVREIAVEKGYYLVDDVPALERAALEMYQEKNKCNILN